jgi:acetylornithine deacetylase/succinyl-diaminopimelate desuccinylase-like protein
MADYLVDALKAEDIDVRTFALEPKRGPTWWRRLHGNGAKKPLLIMGHLDTVNIDPAKCRTRRSPRRAKRATCTGAEPGRQGHTSPPR